MKALDTSAEQLPSAAIAVVGMDGRFPGARTIEEFWDNLCAGREGIRFFTPEEIDPAVPASVRGDPHYVRARGVVDDYDKFDASFFGISPVEASVMDPQQRLTLELAWSTLENAGHVPSAFKGLIGVYVGMNWNRYRANCVAAHPDVVERFGEFNTALANEYDFLATRISYKLNLRGPSVSVSTACSTSLVAIAQAAQALLNFECDLALAGGASITVPVHAGYLHEPGSMLSADGHTRSFDASSTGTTFNDGVGFVALRRLEDAVADGDRIYAVVRGFAVNNDGGDKVSFTAPSVGGQEAVIRSALDYAGIDPSTIGSIEAHGTATPLGDPIEVAALRRVFGNGSNGARTALGSVKSSIGHTIHAAGVAGFIKAALSVYHGKIPPTLFFQTANPRLQLDESPFYVNTTLEEWTPVDHPRRAGVSSFGVGGTNAHVILEQPPRAPAFPDDAGPRVICLSARSADSLALQVAALRHALGESNASDSLASIAYTLQSGREPMPYRAACAVSSVADAVDALGDQRRRLRGKATTARPLAFMFTGQGSQRAHMGQWLYENHAEYRRHFDDGADRLLRRTGFDLRTALFATSAQAEQEVDETRIAQPALFLVEYSLARVLAGMGLAPTILVGHSVGEFVAATIAGVFSLDDALFLVYKRGEAMQAMPRGSMLVVHCGEEDARRFTSEDVSLAAANAPELSVLAGTDAGIARIEAELSAAEMRHKRLRTSHAFHSAMMDPAVESMRAVLAGITLSPPQRTVVSTVTAAPLSAHQATDPEYWARQLREPVRFAAALGTVAALGDATLVEIGPGGTLTTLALQHTGADRFHAHPSLPGSGLDANAARELWSTVAACWANGVDVDWARQWEGAPPSRVSLPTYQFARTRYWLEQPAHVSSSAVAATINPGGDIAVATGSSSSTLDIIVMTQPNRLDGLQRRAIRVLEDTSGYDLADADREISFSELGFDSLMLTQVSAALKKEFAVDITFRALLEDYGSIGELAAHLDGVIPPDAPAPTPAVAAVLDPAPAPSAQPAVNVLPSQPLSAFAMNGSGNTGALPGHVNALIESQLAVMRMQLQVLAGGGLTPPTHPMAAPVLTVAAAPAASAGTGASMASSVAPAAAVAEDKTEEAPRKHTPGTRIEKTRNTSKVLTRTQQDYVDRLIASYVQSTTRSKAYAQRHRKHLADPRTVSGFNPLWKEMVYPIVTTRSRGSKLWDVDGREYVDFTNGFGPIFFGHSPDFVTDAVVQQIHEGIETGPQSPLAGEVAELFCEMTGNERVAYTNTGSEAILAAMRLARTVTGRDKVVMFEGAYHGIVDEVVVRAGKGGLGLPATPGVPRSHTQNMVVLPYGTDETLARLREMGSEIAAILVETVQSRHPGLQPVAFIRELRKITEASGSALVFDEVVTGFRTHPGGMQAMLDIRADMAVYGKVVAGGYPIGLVAGKARFLDALDGGYWEYGDESIPEVGVTFFAGTFVRHPIALAAMKAVLLRLKAEGPALQAGLAERTVTLAAELRAFFTSIDANVTLEDYSSYFYMSVGPGEPYGSLLFYLLRQYGVHTWEFRPQFLTLSHSDADIALFKTAVMRAVSELVAHGLLQGDAVKLERLGKAAAGVPPVDGARLGKDKDGAPAWFIADPDRPGKHIQVSRQLSEASRG